MNTTKDTPVSANIVSVANEMASLAQDALAIAKQLGADSAKVVTNCSFQKRLVVENKIFALANSLESQKIGILVYKDQKKGSASINTRNKSALTQAIKDAMALASFSVPDEALNMPTAAEAPPASQHAFQFDAGTADVTLGEMQEMMQAGLLRATKDSRVSIDKYELASETSWHGLYNSNGVRQSEMQTMLSWYLFGMAIEGDEVSGFDYDNDFAFNRANVPTKIIKTSEEFARRVLCNLKPRKAPTYKGLVLLSPRAVEELLLGFALYHASGTSIMDGKSSWADAIGKNVMAPLVNITDLPHDERFSGATAFDGDGLVTREQKIFENGNLCLHLHDCYSAKRCKTKSNAMNGGPFALRFHGGKTALQDMQKARSELLVIDRFSGNSDPLKGDFSGVAKSSRIFERGQDAGAVTETMIAGNFFEMAKNIAAISSTTEIVSGHAEMPWVLIDNVSVTGT